MAWRRAILPFMSRHGPLRAVCTRRNVPIVRPWRANQSLWDDFFHDFPTPFSRTFRDMDTYFSEMMRRMDRMFPRVWETHYVRPRSAAEVASKSEVAEVKFDGKDFELKLDAQQFSPEELEVKLLNENRLVIRGKHEQKADDHGFVAREFQRELDLPENIDQESITSFITEEGVLVIRAKTNAAQSEKTIKIEKASSKKE
ncbi:hypothetical protein ACJMK2_032361 [Sinanodonta woodiana]|uniref:SHSP domain-containing protein n=1 Tax=Sinanodonta woodiana TaxID=1069815 RepID=A0ABD3X218_SINWO